MEVLKMLISGCSVNNSDGLRNQTQTMHQTQQTTSSSSHSHTKIKITSHSKTWYGSKKSTS